MSTPLATPSSTSATSASLSSTSPSSSPVLCLKFDEADADRGLRLWLEESGVVVEIGVRAFDLNNNNDEDYKDELDDLFRFSNDDVVAKAILNALDGGLKDALLGDLDASSEHVKVAFSPDALSFATKGNNGDFRVEIPSDSEFISQYVVEELEDGGDADNDISNKYRLSMMKHALKPLPAAEKVSLRVDDRGVLCLQYMIRIDDQKTFIEFFCLPESH